MDGLATGMAASHHPAVLAVAREPRRKPAGAVVDLVGSLTRLQFYENLHAQGEAPHEEAVVVPPLPEVRESYFEWIDVLESVREARDRYVVCELGAGWGRWCVRAALALRQLNPMPFRCLAAEAEPRHYRWMREHFRDNGLEPHDHELLWAAVATSPGVVPFWVGTPGAWYGQAIADEKLPPLEPRARRHLRVRGLLGRPLQDTGGARGVRWVPAVTVSEVIGDESRVDLLDLDVQGVELAVLQPSIALLNERVKRVHVGTHSAPIESGLRALFREHAWDCRFDYPCESVVDTPFGRVAFQDGVQSWVNPRLA